MGLRTISRARRALATRRRSQPDEQTKGGEQWLSHREALRRLMVTKAALWKWAKSCSWLPDGRPIETTLVAGRARNSERYYSASDVDKVRRERAQRPAAPDGFVTLADAARQLGIGKRTLYKLLRRAGIKPVVRPGCRMRRRAGGQPMPRESSWRRVIPSAVLARLETGAGETPAVSNGAADGRPASPRGSGGRPTDPMTQEVYEFCFRGYQRGDKLATIRHAASRQFPDYAPKEDANVRLYAARYAKNTGQTLKRRIGKKA